MLGLLPALRSAPPLRPLARRGSGSARLAALREQLRTDSLDRFTGRRAPAPPRPQVEEAPPPPPHAGVPALTDRFGRAHTYLRVSLTERCNLRCTYCMPPEGAALTAAAELLTVDETLAAVAHFVRLGVNKVRLTGGEPTLRRDLVDVVAALHAMRPAGLATLGLTTNGVLLAPLLPQLQRAGLTRLNISLDTWRRERLPHIARRPEAHWDRTWRAVEAALELGFAPLKLNCVVVRGVNDDELADFVRATLDRPLHVRFIELMPFAGNGWSERAFVSTREQLEAIHRSFPEFQPVEPGGGAGGGGGDDDALSHDTARLWRLPRAAGSVGFISSMSDAFCGTCNRLRLTADGHVKACLHGGAHDEMSLRDALRAQLAAGAAAGGADHSAHIEALIRGAVAGKRYALGGRSDRHALAAAAALDSRPMVRIGG